MSLFEPGMALLIFLPAFLSRLVKNRIIKALLSVLSLFAAYILAVSTPLMGWLPPDVIGASGLFIPFMLFGAAFTISMLFTWKPFQPKTRRVLAISAASVSLLISAAAVWPVVYKNSLPQARGEEINLYQYRPFDIYNDKEVTLVKSLTEESSLQLEGDLPRLDGATALYPLYSAFARATYPKDDYDPYYIPGITEEESAVFCTTTDNAFTNLINGDADIVFLMGVSDHQKALAEASGLELNLLPVGWEAFVFFVNSRNQTDNLSSEDIRRIYSGDITNWRDAGGGNDAIRAYQRPEGSGSQTMLQQIMNGTPIVPAPEEDVYTTMMGMVRMVAGYRNYRNSLGYSFLYYIRDMIREYEVKVLSVDGVAPTTENITGGSYPFAHEFYAVTAKRGGGYLHPERAESIDRFLTWIRSPQGQFLVDETGYVPFE